MIRTRRLLVSVAAGLSLMAAPMAGVAHAYTPAPTCVVPEVHEEEDDDRVRLWNNCSTTQRVKVVVAFHADGLCWTLAPGYFVDDTFDDWGSFDGVALC